MSARLFLFLLERNMRIKYPDLYVQFYISRRSKNIHMGLNCALLSIVNNQLLISDSYKHWLSRNWNFDVKFVDPILIHTTKWKFDYIIFKKCQYLLEEKY